MTLPNGDKGVIDERKLVENCLSANHPVGKHKAKLFKAALGISEAHTRWLLDRLV